MRCIKSVLYSILDIVPEEASEMKSQLQHCLRNVTYTAPENMGARWMDFQDIINGNIKYTDDVNTLPRWQQQVVSVFRQGTCAQAP